ncbi:putative nucleotide-binding protein (sugar kinase/HSP70/actin superfamily) [Desulfitispora alkaliphila]|uniref:acyl-CoA dehydratase activase-related protein n=1 Tax=Desulfitispora alkaliphila TaxID=622674 RepID=UPI003D23814F
MEKTVGFPATLFYYSHFPLWKTFFEKLDFKVETSPITTKEILDMGVKETVTDACVPIKIYHGHVMELKDRVDYIFIPRMVSVNKEATFCPKFLGLPDMVRHSIDNLPQLIAPRVDLKKGRFELWKVCKDIGEKLKKGTFQIFQAYRSALKEQKDYENSLLSRAKPLDYLQNNKNSNFLLSKNDTAVKLAILGYPYELYDPFINVNFLKKLEAMNVEIHTVEMLTNEQLKCQISKIPKNLFWHYSNNVIRAHYHYLEKKLDGFIHVTAFGCGPDAMVDKLMELSCKENGVPFMSLIIDEHSGEAGLITRLEAFVDMIRLRSETR